MRFFSCHSYRLNSINLRDTNFLDGFEFKNHLTSTTAIVKTTSILLVTGAGLSVGTESPLVHVGVCVSHCLCLWVKDGVRRVYGSQNPLQQHLQHVDANHRFDRTMLSAAVSAGISVTFDAPIGGVLYALEEMNTPHDSLLPCFICSVISIITSQLFYHGSFMNINHGIGSTILSSSILKNPSLQLQLPSDTQNGWYWSESGWFVMVGVVAGVSGSIFVRLNAAMLSWRLKCPNPISTLTLSICYRSIEWASKFLKRLLGTSDALSDFDSSFSATLTSTTFSSIGSMSSRNDLQSSNSVGNNLHPSNSDVNFSPTGAFSRSTTDGPNTINPVAFFNIQNQRESSRGFQPSAANLDILNSQPRSRDSPPHSSHPTPHSPFSWSAFGALWMELAVLTVLTSILSFPIPLMHDDMFSLLTSLLRPCSDSVPLDPFSLCSTSTTLMMIWLSLAFLMRFSLTCVTFGVNGIPSGILIPSIVIGALFGRGFGLALRLMSLTSIQPHVYALIASAAFLTGTTRLTLSSAVILFEVTGGSALGFIIPLMIAVMTSKIISDRFDSARCTDISTLIRFLMAATRSFCTAWGFNHWFRLSDDDDTEEVQSNVRARQGGRRMVAEEHQTRKNRGGGIVDTSIRLYGYPLLDADQSSPYWTMETSNVSLSSPQHLHSSSHLPLSRTELEPKLSVPAKDVLVMDPSNLVVIPIFATASVIPSQLDLSTLTSFSAFESGRGGFGPYAGAAVAPINSLAQPSLHPFDHTVESLSRLIRHHPFHGYPVVETRESMLLVGYIRHVDILGTIKKAQILYDIGSTAPCYFYSNEKEWLGPSSTSHPPLSPFVNRGASDSANNYPLTDLSASLHQFRSFISFASLITLPIIIQPHTPLCLIVEYFKFGARILMITFHGISTLSPLHGKRHQPGALLGVYTRKDLLNFID